MTRIISNGRQTPISLNSLWPMVWTSATEYDFDIVEVHNLPPFDWMVGIRVGTPTRTGDLREFPPRTWPDI